MDFVAVAAFDARVVGEAVTGVDPTIKPADKVVVHPVRVAVVERAEEDLAFFVVAVAVGIEALVDVGDAVDEELA